MAYENPPYEVVDRDGPFELRQYDEYIVAEVVLEGDYDTTLSPGFRILADYIFGNNRPSRHIAMTVPVTSQVTSSETVAMTAPVISQDQGSGTYRIAFMMPSTYTMESLPEPLDSRIRFRTIPSHSATAIRFSGSLNESNGLSHWKRLRDWMDSRALRAASPPAYANYSPPWIPPFLRRNEVIVDVAESNHV